MSNQYSNEQLINALVKEYEYLCHDDFDPDVDITSDEYRETLQDLTTEDLVEETQTDEQFTLDQFMEAYG